MSLWIKSTSVTIQMNAIEQYLPVVLFIILCKVALTFDAAKKAQNVTIPVISESH